MKKTIVKMSDIDPNEKLVRIYWQKGPNKRKFDFVKMKEIKRLLSLDKDLLVLA